MKRPFTGWQAWGMLLIVFGVATISYFTFGGLTKTAAQAPAGDVVTEGIIALAPDGDLNENNAIDAGDTVTLKFTITNSSSAEYSFARLETGINYNLLHDLWNLRGVASISDDNNTLSFPNLLVPPNGRFTFSVDATVNYFTEGQQQLGLTPQLFDRNNQVIGTVITHPESTRTINPWVGELPPWVYFPGESPLPAATPTPETSPAPSPSATPSPTASALPTVTPSPSTSIQPTITPSLLPTSSPSILPTTTPAFSPSPIGTSPSPSAGGN